MAEDKAEGRVEDKAEDSLENRRFGGVSRLYGPELRERFLNATVVWLA